MTQLITFRETLKQAAHPAPDRVKSIWAWLAEKLDLAQSRPQAASGIITSRLTGREGVYYILKNPQTQTYFRLSDKDYFLWERMDGSLTVKDLVVAYFMEYKVLAFGRVSGLLAGLKSKSFLTEQPVNVYEQVLAQLEQRQPHARLSKIWQGFIEKKFALDGIDQWLTRLYNRVGWLFYARPTQALFWIVCLVGLFCFFRVMLTHEYHLTSVGSSTLLGVVSLFLVYLFSIFIHELGHALTVKHYRREVHRGGFMIYYGFPAFFVDTSDIWMEGKRARLAVTWAGPFADLILAGLASLLLSSCPDFGLHPFLFQFAAVTYLNILFNLNPLLELDGYFLLMDSLEIPMLRRKSLEFVSKGLWLKLKSLRSAGKPHAEWSREFSRAERIFISFGLLSAAWTIYSIFQALWFWQGQVTSTGLALFFRSSTAGRVVILAAGVGLGLALSVSLVSVLAKLLRRLFTFVARDGFFATPWRKAAWGWAAVFGIGILTVVFPPVLPFISLVSLTLALYLAICNARDYGGSRFARVFWLMSLAFLLLWLMEIGKLALTAFPQVDTLNEIIFAAGGLASLSMAGAGLVLFSGAPFAAHRPVEKLGLGFGSLGSLAWIVAMALNGSRNGMQLEIFRSDIVSLFSLITLLLMASTLVSFWRTSSGPALLTNGLGLTALIGNAVVGIPAVWAYLFLVAGFGLQQIAFRQPVALKSRRQNMRVMSDHHLLKQAFGMIAADLVEQFTEIDGMRQTNVLEKLFNQYAEKANWQVHLHQQQITDTLPAGWSLRQMGNTYIAALNLLLGLIVAQLGDKLTQRALQRVYDELPWDEREIAALYLFTEVRGAHALSQQFQKVKQAYSAMLRRIPVLAALSQAEIDLLASRLRTEKFKPGQAIIRQGDHGDKFYIVSSGSVVVEQRSSDGVSEIVNRHQPGGYFGQVALLNDSPRNATCRAVLPTEVLSLSRTDFNQLLKVCFEMYGKIESSITRLNLLRQIPLFADMDSGELQLVVAQLAQEKVETGAVIIRQGEVGATFYVIERGRVEVIAAAEDGDRVVTERGPGEYFGEIALLLQTTRTATVRAAAPTCLLTLAKSDFDRLVVPRLYTSRVLEREISRRMFQLRHAAQH